MMKTYTLPNYAQRHKDAEVQFHAFLTLAIGASELRLPTSTKSVDDVIKLQITFTPVDSLTQGSAAHWFSYRLSISRYIELFPHASLP